MLLIDSIRDAVDKDCLLPAAISVLTIPDAMGQRLYPKLVDKRGKRLCGKQYSRWFDDWVMHEFKFPGLPQVEGDCDFTALTGAMCWKLRCSLLHSGDYDVPVKPHVDEFFSYEYAFELRLHACNAVTVHWAEPLDGKKPVKEVRYIVDLASLANAICDGAERCIEQRSDDIDFPDLDVFDLGAWAEWLHCVH